MRVIDEADARRRIVAFATGLHSEVLPVDTVLMLLTQLQTIDAVPVARCRECKHWKKGEFQAGDDVMHLEYGGYCPNSRFARYESDFCSYGEPKEGAENA